MILVLQLFLFSCILLFLSAYLFFPLLTGLIYFFSKKKKKTEVQAYFPKVSCLISIYNEEKIIEDKIHSLLHQEYPQNLINIYIGSDASTDTSHSIIEKMIQNNSHIHLLKFDKRRGKTSVLNDLVQHIRSISELHKDHIFICTDANVILEKNCIQKLLLEFQNEKIGLVDSNILPYTHKGSDIGKSEIKYIQLETQLKHWEGSLWGCMMGAFGGCYALRSYLMPTLPTNLMVDDFFISMKLLDQSFHCVNSLEAIAYETIPGNMDEEFKRKSRISVGNFQNLIYFKHFLFSFPISRATCFFFHKVVRWISPILLITIITASLILAIIKGGLYSIIFGLFALIFILIPLLDRVLRSINIEITILRNISYFVLMNIALCKGFINYCKGKHTGIWNPTKRNI